MAVPAIGTTSTPTTAGDLLLSIRAQIPDPVVDPSQDGSAFAFATLIRWINDAGRIMASTSPIIKDWHGIASEEGMDIYELPIQTLSVEQLWYDLTPCVRTPEALTIDTTKVTSRSYYFGPHSLHAQPRLQVWPAADRSGSTTTLTSSLTATDRTLPVADATGFEAMGFLGIDSEVILYRTINTAGTSITQTLRGQAGTVATTHSSGATVQERNIMFRMSRLPVAIVNATDPVEIPVGLQPLLELYVLAKVREAEQESMLALQMRREWEGAMTKLTNSAQFAGIRQGLQISEGYNVGLFRGRVFLP